MKPYLGYDNEEKLRIKEFKDRVRASHEDAVFTYGFLPNRELNDDGYRLYRHVIMAHKSTGGFIERVVVAENVIL